MLLFISRDPPKECVSTETHTGDVPSAEYVDSWVGTNDDLSVTGANKGTNTDNECSQLIMGTLSETVYLLKDELRNKQVTINSLIDLIKNFTVIENKYARSKKQEPNICGKRNSDVAGELSEIFELHHRFQKLTDQPQRYTVK